MNKIAVCLVILILTKPIVRTEYSAPPEFVKRVCSDSNTDICLEEYDFVTTYQDILCPYALDCSDCIEYIITKECTPPSVAIVIW